MAVFYAWLKKKVLFEESYAVFHYDYIACYIAFWKKTILVSIGWFLFIINTASSLVESVYVF